MVAAMWGDSGSDAEQEEMNTKCLMFDNEIKEVSLKKYVLLSTLQHLKYIIDDQREQINFLDAITRLL